MYSDSEVFDYDPHDEQNADVDTPLVQLYTFFLFMYQTLFRLSDTALSALITFFSMFLRTITSRFPGIPNSLMEKLPNNLRQAHWFHLFF